MSYEVSGKLKLKQDTQTFSSGFSKREFVVTTDETYPQDIKMEFVKDKCSMLDKYKVGQDVTVSWNLRGNEHNGNYYVNLQAWRIEAGEASQTPSQPVPSGQPMEESEEPPF